MGHDLIIQISEDSEGGERGERKDKRGGRGRIGRRTGSGEEGGNVGVMQGRTEAKREANSLLIWCLLTHNRRERNVGRPRRPRLSLSQVTARGRGG